jgi:anti-anti-sigma factor
VPIGEKNVGRFAVLVVSGDVRGGEEDYRALERMGLQALESGSLLAIDLAHATFIDSQTLGLFVQLLRASQARGGEVVIVGAGPRTDRWFGLSGLNQVFKMVADEEELSAITRPTRKSARLKPVLETVNVDRLVEELEASLGEAGENGLPTQPKTSDEKTLSEIEKLLNEL